VTYLGQGPHETYPDRCFAGDVGLYRHSVDEQYFPYIVPQETGLKMGTRFFALTDEAGLGLQVQSLAAPLMFSALHYTPEDFTAATHTYDLKRRDEAIVLIDAAHRGLGTASCGPDTLEQYLVRPGRYTLRYALVPLSGEKVRRVQVR
jgi:beta-galactosidase